jgi:hypothetical protein
MTIQSNALVNNYNPAFSKIYIDKIKNYEPVFDKVFDVLTSQQQYEYRGNQTATGLLTKKTEGMDASELKVFQKYSKQFIHATYAAYVRITKEAADDDLSGNLKKLPAILADSTKMTIELIAANFWDTSAATNQPDGVPLLSAAHPLVGIGSTAGTNTPAVAATALSVTSMEAALAAMRQNVDDYGNPDPIFPTDLYIHGANEFMSTQLLKNIDKSGTTNRDTNAIRRRGINTIINDYLTVTTQWYLLTPASQRQQLFYWREKIGAQMKPAPDTTDDAIYQSRCRFSLGSIDWRGVYGSQGA